MRGEVSATYLDYPKAAERAAQLLPSARIVVLLREPVSRLVSSFNMKWQVCAHIAPAAHPASLTTPCYSYCAMIIVAIMPSACKPPPA